MPSRKSMKNGKKKTKSRGRKQNCRTLRCKTGRRVNSKGYFRKKTKRKSRKTKGGVEFIQPLIKNEIEIGSYKGEYEGEINGKNERDGNGKLSLINKTENENESSLIIDGEWKDGKLLKGDVEHEEELEDGEFKFNILIMNLRNEMDPIADSSLKTYYTITYNQDNPLDNKTLDLIQDNLSDLFFKEEAFDWLSSNKLLEEYGGEEDSKKNI